MGSKILANGEIYDPHEDTCCEMASMTIPRCEFGEHSSLDTQSCKKGFWWHGILLFGPFWATKGSIENFCIFDNVFIIHFSIFNVFIGKTNNKLKFLYILASHSGA